MKPDEEMPKPVEHQTEHEIAASNAELNHGQLEEVVISRSLPQNIAYPELILNASQLNNSSEVPSITDSEQSANTLDTQRSDNISSFSSLDFEQIDLQNNPVEQIPERQNGERLRIHPEQPAIRVEDSIGHTP